MAACIPACASAAIADMFGAAVCALGDIDGDTYVDIAIGDPANNAPDSMGPGQVWLLSGRDWSMLGTISGPYEGSGFGALVINCGDLDGDGVDDLLVGGGDGGRPAKERRGFLATYSTATRELLAKCDLWVGDNPSAAIIGDINGDLHPDILVGVPTMQNGIVYVLSGRTLEVLRKIPGETSAFGFGAAVTALGDVDNDGIPDWAASTVPPCSPYAAKVVLERAAPMNAAVGIYSGSSGCSAPGSLDSGLRVITRGP